MLVDAIDHLHRLDHRPDVVLMLHRWTDAGGIVSHYSQIGSFEGPYPFA